MHQTFMVGPYPTHDFRAVESWCDGRGVAEPLCDVSGAWDNVEMYGLSRLTKPQKVDSLGAYQCVKDAFCDAKAFRKIGIGPGRQGIKLGGRQMGFED
ncbi:hypothetical protein [Paraburkholderia tropica]|uniref:hypothetical protein n=1 Tax=Paraburkholderia tropica TaxID=92647 RepID=UPI0011B53FA1|nr:hypothetical protein [Paraburkholderia tropica]MBB3001334.1 hypothetical protein [Paraburkholderia tropica]MBB6320966.1 hypothetical protein [Paraburkholderia tropica]MDE1140592.1 hypothetical protein [Paraburkholderia tropica]